MVAFRTLSPQQEIDRLVKLEQEARVAASHAPNADDRDDHFMRAERYADRVWSLQEAHDLPYRASGLWAG